ncbi:MAG: hypothetical protein EB072_03450 [Betaproteobacteria bacterium]|nr:hypothetical protein [Betaproteobacteria bacterium]
MIISAAFDPWVAALGSQPKVDNAAGGAKEAAQQFEALLIRQFLANARSTSWLSDQEESESGWREIADDALAGYLVRAGGIGLSKQVESLIAQTQFSRETRRLNPENHSTVIPNVPAAGAVSSSKLGSN